MPPEILNEPLKATPPERERLPFAGVFRRGWAFLLDGMLFYLIGHFLERLARPVLLQINPWLPWLSFLLTFLYFWLANGPVGRGRTVGKLITHLIVVDPAGMPLKAMPAFRRALIQQFGLLIFIGMNPGYATLIFPQSIRTQAAMAILILMLLCLSWLVALVVSVAVHPFKRGWHDEWGGSYVCFAPEAHRMPSVLSGPLDPMTEGRLKKHRLITLGFWVMATLALLIYPLRALTAPEVREDARTIKALQVQVDPEFSPYSLIQAIMADPEQRVEVLKRIRIERQHQAAELRKQQQSGRPAGKVIVVDSTETLLSKFEQNGETNLALVMRRHGAFSPVDLEQQAFRAAVEKVRQALWKNWQDKYSKKETPDSTAVAQPTRFTMLLYEPLQLFFNNTTVLHARVSGPAEPNAGSLNYEIIPATNPSVATPELAIPGRDPAHSSNHATTSDSVQSTTSTGAGDQH